MRKRFFAFRSWTGGRCSYTTESVRCGSGVRVRSNVSLWLEQGNQMVQTWDAQERSRRELYLPRQTTPFGRHGPHETLPQSAMTVLTACCVEERWTCVLQWDHHPKGAVSREAATHPSPSAQCPPPPALGLDRHCPMPEQPEIRLHS